jgi:hypothetical protein
MSIFPAVIESDYTRKNNNYKPGRTTTTPS